MSGIMHNKRERKIKSSYRMQYVHICIGLHANRMQTHPLHSLLFSESSVIAVNDNECMYKVPVESLDTPPHSLHKCHLYTRLY